MTDKQMQAVKLLNRLKEALTEEEYFMLLEYVVAPPPQEQYVPIYPTNPTTPQFPIWPSSPWCAWQTTCETDAKNKESATK